MKLQRANATIERVQALLDHARKISPSPLMNIRADDLEAAIRGVAPAPSRVGMIADDHPKEEA